MAPIIVALANPALRRRLAQHILASPEPNVRKKPDPTVLDSRLKESGLLTESYAELVVNESVLRDLLSRNVTGTTVGWERFLRYLPKPQTTSRS